MPKPDRAGEEACGSGFGSESLGREISWGSNRWITRFARLAPRCRAASSWRLPRRRPGWAAAAARPRKSRRPHRRIANRRARAAPLPAITLGKFPISRLIVGANPINGYFVPRAARDRAHETVVRAAASRRFPVGLRAGRHHRPSVFGFAPGESHPPRCPRARLEDVVSRLAQRPGKARRVGA